MYFQVINKERYRHPLKDDIITMKEIHVKLNGLNFLQEDVMIYVVCFENVYPSGQTDPKMFQLNKSKLRKLMSVDQGLINGAFYPKKHVVNYKNSAKERNKKMDETGYLNRFFKQK